MCSPIVKPRPKGSYCLCKNGPSAPEIVNKDWSETSEADISNIANNAEVCCVDKPCNPECWNFQEKKGAGAYGLDDLLKDVDSMVCPRN